MVCVSNYGLLLNWSNRQRYRRRKAECIEVKVSEEALKGGDNVEKKISDLKLKFWVSNDDELKKLLRDAKQQLEQLNKTLDEISNFELNIKTQVCD